MDDALPYTNDLPDYLGPRADELDFNVVPEPTAQPTAREARRHPDAIDAQRQNRRAARPRKGGRS